MIAAFHCSYKQADVASPEVSGTITVPSGGTPKNWTVAAGTYDDFDELATAIQTAINAQYSGHVVGWDTGLWSADSVFQVYSSASFDITVSDPLKAFTGLPASATGELRSTVYYVEGDTPGAFFSPSRPLSVNDKVRVYNRDQSFHGTTVYTVDRQQDEHDYEARVLWVGTDERDQLRSFLEYARAGTPFRLYVNVADATAWADDNLDGYLDCVLPDELSTTAEAMLNEPIGAVGYFDLRCHVLV